MATLPEEKEALDGRIRQRKKKVGFFKSRKTNIDLTVYSYIGRDYTKFKEEGSKVNVKELNDYIEKLNLTREPEAQIPLLPKDGLSFYMYALGPSGKYELYFSELSGINKNDIKYRRLYRILKFYLKDVDLVKEVEESLLPIGEEAVELFPIEWIEKKI